MHIFQSFCKSLRTSLLMGTIHSFMFSNNSLLSQNADIFFQFFKVNPLFCFERWHILSIYLRKRNLWFWPILYYLFIFLITKNIIIIVIKFIDSIKFIHCPSLKSRRLTEEYSATDLNMLCIVDMVHYQI